MVTSWDESRNRNTEKKKDLCMEEIQKALEVFTEESVSKDETQDLLRDDSWRWLLDSPEKKKLLFNPLLRKIRHRESNSWSPPRKYSLPEHVKSSGAFEEALGSLFFYRDFLTADNILTQACSSVPVSPRSSK